MKCLICDRECKSNSSLAGHLGRGHKISLEEYYETYVLKGKRPKCPVCGEDTRFDRVSKSFKKFCTKHANEARREWSKKNQTLDYGWKKGLTKETHSGIASQAEKISGKNNPWYKGLPKHVIEAASESRKKELPLSTEEFIEKSLLIHKGLYSYEDVNYKNTLEPVRIMCSEHGVFEQKPRDHIQGCGCPKCIRSVSKQEREIYDFIKSVTTDVESSNRKVVEPKELDIYVPDKSFALEFNGLYWHSEEFVSRKYHLEKTSACLKEGVSLIQIFSDEWREKPEIVKSMIRHRLKATKNRIYARKCSIQKVKTEEVKRFFYDTHLAGYVPSRKVFGLFYEGEMVSAISLRKPWQKRYGNILEIARFSTKLDTVVVGGFQKLLKHSKEWTKKEGFEGILTYADRRFGEGAVYERAGFEPLGQTAVDYWYTNGFQRFNRFKYKAKDGKTEKEIARENKVARIFGCGSNVYLLYL